jgi:glycosyltransferase involved in cell wall biosynthesis
MIRQQPAPADDADVCLIVEGCYPFVAGGVSTWLDWLMRSQPQTRFSVVAIVAAGQPRVAKYAYPPNMAALQVIELGGAVEPASWTGAHRDAAVRLTPLLASFVTHGKLDDLRAVNAIVNDPSRPIPLRALVRSELSWEMCRASYDLLMPYASFKGYFWAWHALMDGLFAMLKAPLPRAAAYHTISTGYAGLLAARARLEGAERAIITEHGIYTNERRVEVLMAPWIVDTVDKGLALDDARMDLRDLWVAAFESYARCCYEACDTITTLFGANQPMQTALGAGENKLQVIANGIDVERFGAVEARRSADRVVMALIGRVVPIKDIKSFISAVAVAARAVPNLHAVVAGPEDEDRTYAAECRALVDELGIGERLKFLGRVDVTKLLGEVDVAVLTSLSEAQPLSVLEAGAAGIPSITTDVGACRELIEGTPDENPRHGPGGIVTSIAGIDEIAQAMVRLAGDAALRRRMGESMKARVRARYSSDRSSALYRDMYARPPLRGAA